MNDALFTLIGLVLGTALGYAVHRTLPNRCNFCGYRDDQTQELFETEELNRLLEEESE